MLIERHGSISYAVITSALRSNAKNKRFSAQHHLFPFIFLVFYSYPLSSSLFFPHSISQQAYLSSRKDLNQMKGWEVVYSLVSSVFSHTLLLLFAVALFFLLPLLFIHAFLVLLLASSPPALFLSLTLSLSLCRFPALTNSSSFFSLRQPDYISYMSLPERALSLYTFSLPFTLSLSTQFTFPLLLSISSLWRWWSPRETGSCWLARSVNVYICMLNDLREFIYSCIIYII